MNNKIILAINPEHVDNIMKGVKKYEYRTRVAKRQIDSILIYCTNPIKKVVAEVKIKNILNDMPERLWSITKDFSGISKLFYDKYFQNHETAYAYELGEIKRYRKPKDLSEYGCNFAPQSYIYVTE